MDQKKKTRKFKPNTSKANEKVKDDLNPIHKPKKEVAQKKPKTELKTKPRKEKTFIQTKGVFGSDNVDKVSRGSAVGDKWGSSTGSGDHFRIKRENYQSRPRGSNLKPATKEEIMVEQKETERILDELGEGFIEVDQHLLSHPDLMPIKVGETTRDIQEIRRKMDEIDDEDFLSVLRSGHSDRVFLLQMSDLPIVPESSLDDDYDPNEELLIGQIDLNGIIRSNKSINLKIESGTESDFQQELVRMTSSSIQSVGDVTSKLILKPDVEQLLSVEGHT